MTQQALVAVGLGVQNQAFLNELQLMHQETVLLVTS